MPARSRSHAPSYLQFCLFCSINLSITGKRASAARALTRLAHIATSFIIVLLTSGHSLRKPCIMVGYIVIATHCLFFRTRQLKHNCAHIMVHNARKRSLCPIISVIFNWRVISSAMYGSGLRPDGANVLCFGSVGNLV